MNELQTELLPPLSDNSDIINEIKAIQMQYDAIQMQYNKLNDRLNGMGKLMLESNDSMQEVLTIAKETPKTRQVTPYCSETTGKIAEALSKAQREFGGISGSGVANRGSFTTLEDMEAITTPILEKNGLSVTPMLNMNEYGEFIQIMRLSHSSGEWFESRLLLKENLCPKSAGLNDFQAVGYAEKYLKRYMYRNILCLADNSKD